MCRAFFTLRTSSLFTIYLKNFQPRSTHFTVVSTIYLAFYAPILPLSLSLASFLLHTRPPPSYHPHNSSVHSLQYEPNQTSGPLTAQKPCKTLQSRRTCLSSGASKTLDRTDEEYQTVAVSVHPPPFRGTSHSRQKQWIRLPSETMREGLVFKVVPLTVALTAKRTSVW